MTIVEFLRARLDELDPSVADAWRMNDEAPLAYLQADVEAKRQIVDRCEVALEDTELAHFARSLLHLHALPFAEHPDYQQEWAPS